MARPKKADEQKQLAPAMQPHPQAAPLPQSVPVAVPVAAAPPPIMNHANRSIDVPNFIRVRDSVGPNPPFLPDLVPPTCPSSHHHPASTPARQHPSASGTTTAQPAPVPHPAGRMSGRHHRRCHCHPALPPSALCQFRSTGVCSYPAPPSTCPYHHLINTACCTSEHEKGKNEEKNTTQLISPAFTSLYYPHTIPSQSLRHSRDQLVTLLWDHESL